MLLVVGPILWSILIQYVTGDYKNIDCGTSASPEEIEEYRRDCAERVGVFNECGSICSPGEACPMVCHFICEFE